MTMRAVAVRSNANFGLKRSCSSCGTRFYDFNRAEATCPKCGALALAGPAAPKLEFRVEVDEDEVREARKLAGIDDAEIAADPQDLTDFEVDTEGLELDDDEELDSAEGDDWDGSDDEAEPEE